MHRLSAAAALLVASAGLLGLPGGTAQAAPIVECPGQVTLLSQANVEVEQRGGVTITEFDYTARESLCLSDGSVVDAHEVGHLELRQRANGTGSVHFVSTLTYGGGSLLGIGNGRIDSTGTIHGIIVVPSGSGSLAGVTAIGTFQSTGPTTFTNHVWYRYP